MGNGDGMNERNDKGEGDTGPQAESISGVALIVYSYVFRWEWWELKASFGGKIVKVGLLESILWVLDSLYDI